MCGRVNTALQTDKKLIPPTGRDAISDFQGLNLREKQHLLHLTTQKASFILYKESTGGQGRNQLVRGRSARVLGMRATESPLRLKDYQESRLICSQGNSFFTCTALNTQEQWAELSRWPLYWKPRLKSKSPLMAWPEDTGQQEESVRVMWLVKMRCRWTSRSKEVRDLCYLRQEYWISVGSSDVPAVEFAHMRLSERSLWGLKQCKEIKLLFNSTRGLSGGSLPSIC